jgi:HEAT repeat protein
MTPAERSQLFDALSELPPQDLERLLFELNVPRKNIPGPAASPSDRVAALLAWADSLIGCGLEEVHLAFERLLQKQIPVDFDNFSEYLKSVISDPLYQDVRELYTETEALLTLEAKYAPLKGEEKTFTVVDELHKFVLGQPNQINKKNSGEEAKGGHTKHIILSGRPGSGKSTTLKRLLLLLAETALKDRSQPIPVLVSLKENKTIFELIQAKFFRARVRVKPEQIEEWIFENRLVLLLDGVNEIPSHHYRRELQFFREKNPTISMIFTTRDLSTGGDLLGVEKQLEMSPLNVSQMHSFVEKYLTRKGRPELTNRLLGQLKDRLREIAETPLLLKMFCDVFDPETQLIPQNKGELFQIFDRDYERIKKIEKAVPVSENFWEFKTDVLKFLAFSLIQGNNPNSNSSLFSLLRQDAERLLEHWLSSRQISEAATKAKIWLKDLLNCHLLQDATEPHKIEFHHQLFQEYYAAEEMLIRLRDGDRNLNEDKRFQYFFLNRLKWTETISLMMSLLNNQDHDLMIRITRLALDTDLLLGAKLAGSVKREFQNNTIGLLLKPKIKISIFGLPISLRSPEWLKILAWQETKSAALREEWLNLLDSDSSWERWQAIRGLRYCEPKDLANAFSKALDDEDDDVRLVAIKGLADLNSDVLLGSLMKATKDNNWSIRREAIQILIGLRTKNIKGLVDVNSDAVLGSLIKATKDSNRSVQEEAFQALIELKTEKSVPFFREMLDDESGIIRHYAVQGLSELGPEFAVPELTALTGNRRLFPAVSAFLGKIGTEDAFLGLLKALENTEPAARKHAIKEIGKFNSELAIPNLINVLNHDKDFSVRTKAASVLGELGKEEVVPALIEALNQRHHSVYLAAAVALMKFEPEISLSRLQTALLDKEVEVRESVIAALKGIEAEQRSPLLVKALEDKEPHIRCRAIHELGEIGSKGIEYLQPILKDSSKSVRQVAALTLAEKGMSSGILEILLMLEEKEPDTLYPPSYPYREAKAALEKMGFQKIIPNLRQFIESNNPDDDSLLIKWFLPNVIAELLLVSTDGEDFLREDAKYILRKIPSQKILQGHLEALAHPDEKVRFSAENALKMRDVSEVLSEAAKISLRRDDGTIFRSLMELFPADFYKCFVDGDGDFSVREEYSKDSTVPVLQDFSGNRKHVSENTIRLLGKAVEKDDIDFLLRVIQICSTIIPQQSAPILLKLLKSKHSIISETAYEQLISLGPDNFLPELINMVEKENNFEIRNMAIRLLGFSKSKKAASAMPLLSNLLFSRSGSISLNALKAIQTNCQFYSYSIAQLNLKPANRQVLESSKQTININQVDTLYSHQINTLNSNQMGILNNVNNGDINIEGDQKGFN